MVMNDICDHVRRQEDPLHEIIFLLVFTFFVSIVIVGILLAQLDLLHFIILMIVFSIVWILIKRKIR